jgi:hypothetical protein
MILKMNMQKIIKLMNFLHLRSFRENKKLGETQLIRKYGEIEF